MQARDCAPPRDINRPWSFAFHAATYSAANAFTSAGTCVYDSILFTYCSVVSPSGSLWLCPCADAITVSANPATHIACPARIRSLKEVFPAACHHSPRPAIPQPVPRLTASSLTASSLIVPSLTASSPPASSPPSHRRIYNPVFVVSSSNPHHRRSPTQPERWLHGSVQSYP